MDTDAEAHRAHYQDKARMDELRGQIAPLLNDPPKSWSRTTLLALASVAVSLRQESERIERMWD